MQDLSTGLDGTPYTDFVRINTLSDTSEEGVRQYLKNNPNLIFHRGYFPSTAIGLEDTTFALVHLDCDQHDSMAAGLEFFYPRLSPGGVIICHDYGIYSGVKTAVDNFLSDKPEVPIEFPDGAGSSLIVKAR